MGADATRRLSGSESLVNALARALLIDYAGVGTAAKRTSTGYWMSRQPPCRDRVNAE